jgi:type IV secretion system protein VirB10
MSEAATYPAAEPQDVRPVVRTSGTRDRGPWIFGILLLLGGAVLFSALSSRRDALSNSTLPTGQGGGLISAPPPLGLPSAYPDYVYPDGQRFRVARPSLVAAPDVPSPQVVTRIVERPSAPAMSPDDIATILAQQGRAAEPQPIAPPPQYAAATQTFDSDERVAAGRLVNPSLTVPKGTIVAAVLETALDSSRPGAVRAIVSRDVKSFDGSRVLIPRGSRIYGEYNSDVNSGQKRALIRWQRLTRPDAVVIDLDSPAADPLGRAGVEGKVNSHFFARFGSAILQSVLDIGVGLATRSVTRDGTVIVGLPGSTQQVTGQLQQQTQVQPTLRVRQGTSVSVFVARDLDFSTVDG